MTGQAGERGEVEAKLKTDEQLVLLRNLDIFADGGSNYGAMYATVERILAAHVRAAQERAVAEERERLAVLLDDLATTAGCDNDWQEGWGNGVRAGAVMLRVIARASRPEPERGEGTT